MQKQWEINWQDYYEILEVDRTADAETIKRSYRNLASKYHPDVNKEEDATEKIENINLAYEVLSNEEEKKLYDAAWDSRKNGTFNQENNVNGFNNVNYEDVEKHYTESEKKYAEKLALKTIIEEELKKVQLIIDAKSEIIYSSLSESVSKEEYYETVKGFVNLCSEFAGGLNEYSEKAYEYDMLSDVELINQTIQYLEKVIEDIPTSLTDAKDYVNRENYKEAAESKIKELLEENKNIVKSLRDILIYVYDKKINHLEYNNILKGILLEAQSNLSDLKQVYLISNELGLDSYNQEITEALAVLNSVVIDMPNDYKMAASKGYIEKIKYKIDNVVSLWHEREDKIKKIEKLLNKYPRYKIYKMLYDYGITIYDDLLKELELIMTENKIGVNSDGTNKYTNIQSLSKESEELYNQAMEINKNVDSILGNLNLSEDLTLFDIEIICEAVGSIFDKKKTFEILIESGKLSLMASYFRSSGIQDFYNEKKASINAFKDRFISMYNMSDGTIYSQMINKISNDTKILEEELEKYKSKKFKVTFVLFSLYFGYIIFDNKRADGTGLLLFFVTLFVNYGIGNYMDKKYEIEKLQNEIKRKKKGYNI